MKENRKTQLSASYTVEASAVVPLLLALVLLSVIAAFILHDRAVLQADTIGRAFGKEREAGTFFAAEPARFSEERGLTETTWTGTARYQGFSLPLFQLFWREGSMEERWSASRMEMPDFLRLWDVLRPEKKQEEEKDGN